jgi:hypothetical protein
MPKALRLPAYLLLAAVMAFELSVGWNALHPTASPDYRAFYIDQSTTCLNQPAVEGTYDLDTRVSFQPIGGREAWPLKVCGWEGPAGDGTHAVGESARLRLVYERPATALTLFLYMIAVREAGTAGQRVVVLINGRAVGETLVPSDRPATATFALPPEVAAAAAGRIELELLFPDALTITPGDSNTRKRSIKLLALRLAPV